MNYMRIETYLGSPCYATIDFFDSQVKVSNVSNIISFGPSIFYWVPMENLGLWATIVTTNQHNFIVQNGTPHPKRATGVYSDYSMYLLQGHISRHNQCLSIPTRVPWKPPIAYNCPWKFTNSNEALG